MVWESLGGQAPSPVGFLRLLRSCRGVWGAMKASGGVLSEGGTRAILAQLQGKWKSPVVGLCPRALHWPQGSPAVGFCCGDQGAN